MHRSANGLQIPHLTCRCRAYDSKPSPLKGKVAGMVGVSLASKVWRLSVFLLV